MALTLDDEPAPVVDAIAEAERKLAMGETRRPIGPLTSPKPKTVSGPSHLRLTADLFTTVYRRINAMEASVPGKRSDLLRSMMGSMESLAHRVLALEKRIAQLEGDRD